MTYIVKPLSFEPTKLKGLSEKLILGHWENNYGGAVRRLNAITAQLAELDFAKAPIFAINGLKREELIATNSMILHELYFESLGGDGMSDGAIEEPLTHDFGSVERWRAEFVGTGKALRGGAGWVLLTYSHRDRRLVNQWAADHTHALAAERRSWRSTCMSTRISSTTVPQPRVTSTRSWTASTGRTLLGFIRPTRPAKLNRSRGVEGHPMSKQESRFHDREGRTTMKQVIMPIAVRPWTLNGISEQMIVSHYENNYGGAVRTLNAVRRDIGELAGTAAPYRLRALKREELLAMNSVELHERYFANLGGEGNARAGVGLAGSRTDQMPDAVSSLIVEQFGSVSEWRRDFVGCAQSLAGGAGWVLLACSRQQKRLLNQTTADHAQAPVDATPVLVLDMYEHAYNLDFGANATAYIDAFMRNINWSAVHERIAAVLADRPLPQEDPSDQGKPSLSVEELAAQMAKGEPIQVVDARPRHHISRTADLMEGATWRDPEGLEEWIGELSPDRPVVVYCAYGFHIGCNVALTLRERGFDARYVRGGVSAWYAAGGARAMHPSDNEGER